MYAVDAALSLQMARQSSMLRRMVEVVPKTLTILGEFFSVVGENERVTPLLQTELNRVESVDCTISAGEAFTSAPFSRRYFTISTSPGKTASSGVTIDPL